MSDTIRILSTTSKLLFDMLNVLNKPENKDPFEVGCRCKTPETQDHLFEVLSLIFKLEDTIRVVKKDESNIVCLIRD